MKSCSRFLLDIYTFLALKKSWHATTGQQQGNDNQQKTLNQYGLSLVIALLLLPKVSQVKIHKRDLT